MQGDRVQRRTRLRSQVVHQPPVGRGERPVGRRDDVQLAHRLAEVANDECLVWLVDGWSRIPRGPCLTPGQRDGDAGRLSRESLGECLSGGREDLVDRGGVDETLGERRERLVRRARSPRTRRRAARSSPPRAGENIAATAAVAISAGSTSSSLTCTPTTRAATSTTTTYTVAITTASSGVLDRTHQQRIEVPDPVAQGAHCQRDRDADAAEHEEDDTRRVKSGQ